MENDKVEFESVSTLGPKKVEDNHKVNVKFAGHLKYFIEGLREDEDEQEALLKLALKQFQSVPFEMIKESCNECHGRGFTGYEKTSNRFVYCRSCFKPN